MLERARRLGGTLEVGPRDGGGTRVQLTFSLRARRGGARDRGGRLMAAVRIVLIDDHALCRSGLSDLLRQRGGMDVVAALGDPERLAERAARAAAGSARARPAHADDRRPGAVAALARRGHRDAGGDPDDERFGSRPVGRTARRRARLPAEGHGARRRRHRDRTRRAGRACRGAGDDAQARAAAAARRQGRRPARTARLADRARARDPRPPRARREQQGDRARTRHQPRHRQAACAAHPVQAQPELARGGRGLCGRGARLGLALIGAAAIFELASGAAGPVAGHLAYQQQEALEWPHVAHRLQLRALEVQAAEHHRAHRAVFARAHLAPARRLGPHQIVGAAVEWRRPGAAAVGAHRLVVLERHLHLDARARRAVGTVDLHRLVAAPAVVLHPVGLDQLGGQRGVGIPGIAHGPGPGLGHGDVGGLGETPALRRRCWRRSRHAAANLDCGSRFRRPGVG